MPSLKELRAQAELAIFDETGLEAVLRPRTIEKGLANMTAQLVFGIYGFAAIMRSQLFTSAYALHWAGALAIERHAAQPATGKITITGTNGSSTPIGTILVHEATGVQYETTSTVAIADGEAIVDIEALVGGEAGNQPGGITLVFLTSHPGVDSEATVTSDGLSDGFDIESLDLLWERVLLRVRTRGAAGNDQDYEAWAREVAGVTRAKCFPKYHGAGTVYVIIVADGGASPAPSAGQISDVYDYITDPGRAPSPATVSVSGPNIVSVPIEIQIDGDPVNAGEIAAVELQLKDLFERRKWDFGEDVIPDEVDDAIAAVLDRDRYTLVSPAVKYTAPETGILAREATIWS